MKLIRHPDSPASPAEAIEVRADRPGGGRLSLQFAVTGDMSRLRMPVMGSGERRDGLWRHSCFEAFIRWPHQSEYLELNLSPSGDWAAYRFEDYRAGMAPAEIRTPVMESRASPHHLGLIAEVDLASIAELPPSQPWRVGFSAVIEAEDGSLSHWALAHPTGVADFHHPDCFVLELPPAGEP